jgi:acyl-CoA oxidase
LSPEKSIIDYQVQRYRVFRQLALSYAIKFTGSSMLKRFQSLDGIGGLKNLDSLPEIAAISGGLKGLCTFLAWQGIEDLRKCCGGNGYLMSSGLAPLAANYVWQTTAEGDWTLLMLSTAQFLLKSLRNAIEGKPLSETVAYLAPLQQESFNLATATLPAASSAQEYTNLDFLLNLFNTSALLNVAPVGELFQQKLSELNGRFDEAFNAIALELINAVRAHCLNFMLHSFVNVVSDVQDPSVKAVLSGLVAIFACSNILDDSHWTGLITIPQMQMVKHIVPQLLEQIRPNAVALVDAFDFSR